MPPILILHLLSLRTCHSLEPTEYDVINKSDTKNVYCENILGSVENPKKPPVLTRSKVETTSIMDLLQPFWNTLRSESSNKNFRSFLKVHVGRSHSKVSHLCCLLFPGFFLSLLFQSWDEGWKMFMIWICGQICHILTGTFGCVGKDVCKIYGYQLMNPVVCHIYWSISKRVFLGCLESKPLSLLPSWALNFLPFCFSLCHLHLPHFLSCLTFSTKWCCANATPVTYPWPIMPWAHSQSSRWCVFFPQSNINFHNQVSVLFLIFE